MVRGLCGNEVPLCNDFIARNGGPRKEENLLIQECADRSTRERRKIFNKFRFMQDDFGHCPECRWPCLRLLAYDHNIEKPPNDVKRLRKNSILPASSTWNARLIRLSARRDAEVAGIQSSGFKWASMSSRWQRANSSYNARSIFRPWDKMSSGTWPVPSK